MIWYPESCHFTYFLFGARPGTKIRALLILVASLLTHYLYPQAFRNFSGENEFAPRGAILSITQDQEGYMWFASPTGVWRYDGNRFTKYGRTLTDANDDSRLYVYCVMTDSQDRLFAGTNDGLYQFNREKERLEPLLRHDPNNHNSLSNDHIRAIYEDKKGRLWAGTNDGLDLIIFGKGNMTVSRKLPADLVERSRAVRSIAETPDGTLWLGTYNGLVRFRSEHDTQLFKRTTKVPSTKLNQFVEVFADKNGTVWLGSNQGGLVKFDPTTQTFAIVDSFRDPLGDLPVVNKLSVDPSGRCWVATESGLALYDSVKKTGKWYRWQANNPYSLSDNVLFSQHIDNQGGLWLGSYYWGVNYWHPDAPEFSKWPEETLGVPYEEFFNGWIGAQPEGLSWILSNSPKKLIVRDEAKGQSRLYTLSIPSPESYRLFMMDRKGMFWCASPSGLCRVDLERNRSKFFSFGRNKGMPNSMIQDKSGMIWLGGGFGLQRFNETDGSFETIKGVSHEVTGIFEDSQGKVWVGSKGATFRISLDGKLLDSCETDGHFSKFVEDSQGNVWSVLNKTLVKFDAKNTRLAFEQVVTGAFWAIEIDKNDFLWLPEETHLKRFDPKAKTIQTFSYREGLPQHSLFGFPDSFKDAESRLYFTTNHETLRFDPNSINYMDAPSRVVLTSLKLFNKPVRIDDQTGLLSQSLNQTKQIRFQHDQNVFSLEFALLSFFKADANQYAYRIKGFDKDWNYVNTPTATYTNLPSGTYTFQVKAANGDGLWTKKPVELEVVILPPWWQTWHAYLLYSGLLAALVYGITRFFWLRTLVRKENEVYQAKLDFFTNISHEIRTHLSLISGPLESAFRSLEPADSTRKLLGYAKSNSDRLLSLVSELLDFRKIQNGKVKLWIAEYDITKNLRSVLAAFERQANEKDITLRLHAPEQPVLLWVDIGQMQKVFYNLVSNALKFTPDGGSITITVKEALNDVTIEFKDNGKGIAPEHLDNLFSNFYQVYDSSQSNTGYGIGLALSKEVVLRHHGEISVTSRPATHHVPGETRFTIRLLTGPQAFENDETIEKIDSATLSPMLLKHPDFDSKPLIDDELKIKNEVFTVLYIEDNDELRAFGSDTLRNHYTVLEADNGKTGLAMAKEHIPDLIVCDVMMPELNGLEVCKLLKEDFNTRHIPVILASARSTSSQMMEGLAAGAADYLVKPFSFEVLELKIQNLIRAREVLRAQYSQVVSLEPTELKLKDLDGEFLTKLRDLVLEKIGDSKLGVDEIAFQTGMSVSVLYRKLRALTGMTVNEFIKSLRMKTALQLLESGQYNVNEVSNFVGYDDSKYFSKEFKKVYDKNPTDVRKQAQSEKEQKKNNT